MANYYFDSSALIKRYVTETGSAWVRRVLVPARRNRAYTVRITGAEIVAAFALRRRTGTIPLSAAQAAIRQFMLDFGSRFDVVEVTPSLVEAAMMLAEKHELRGYDSVQLAAALSVHLSRKDRPIRSLTFVSADGRLNEAAAAEGLTVVSPTNHQ
jgi:uncharacterized protein